MVCTDFSMTPITWCRRIPADLMLHRISVIEFALISPIHGH